MQPNSSKSTESLYSSTSSKYSASAVYTRPSHLQIRKTTAVSNTNIGSRSGEVRQRVLSARRLRMKTLQNQLANAQLHIAELAQENRILRTLHKRQDSALSKYENTNAELPQLLHSHAEEIRVWQSKYKNLQNQNKDIATRLKQKDTVILNLNDQNKHLTQLNNDKNLEDRERLTERVRYLEQRLHERDNEIKLMARKLQLEKKSFKNQLQSEHSKYKDLMTRLEKTKTELTGLSKIDPLGIADKLAKVSILPKPIRNLEKIPDLKHNENPNASVIDTNDYEEGRNFETVTFERRNTTKPCDETNNAINENSNFKNHITKPRNRSLSPKFEKDFNSNTPSPITMRRKSSLDRKSVELDRKCKSSMENAFEMNIVLKDNFDDISVTNTSEANFKEYAKWRNKVSILSTETEEFNAENYQEYEYGNTFEDEDDHPNNLIDNNYNDVTVLAETSHQLTRSNSDISNIKKQIMNDYEDREKFLDTFCRDSSSDAVGYLKEDFKKISNVDSKKKTKLLAALKAIDENRSKASPV